jgi:hypothetical protein
MINIVGQTTASTKKNNLSNPFMEDLPSMDDNLGPRLTAKFTDLAPLSTDQLIPFNLHFQPENIMPRENNRSFTPLEDAQNGASLFARNLLLSTALTETLKQIDTVRLEGDEIARKLRDSLDSEGSKKEKEKLTEALKCKIADCQFLLNTVMSCPTEENV